MEIKLDKIVVEKIQDSFIRKICEDLLKAGISNTLSKEFVHWCCSNDFHSFDLRIEIAAAIEKVKNPRTYPIKYV